MTVSVIVNRDDLPQWVLNYENKFKNWVDYQIKNDIPHKDYVKAYREHIGVWYKCEIDFKPTREKVFMKFTFKSNKDKTFFLLLH
jgi:hypothetical protein